MHPALLAGAVGALAGALATGGPARAVLVGASGALLGPVLRGYILRFSVPAGQPWRRSCPYCAVPLLPAGRWSRIPAVPPNGRRSRIPPAPAVPPNGRWSRIPAVPPNGRCPGCRARIGPPPLAVEGVAAVALGVLGYAVTGSLPLLACCWVALLGVVLGFVDVAVHRLPDRLTLAAATGALVVLGAAAADLGRPDRLAVAAGCALAVATGYLVLVLANPGGMGLGDAKIALALGLVTGWYGWLAALLGAVLGVLLAGLAAAAALALRRVTPGQHLPHGPFMLLGALAAVTLAAVGSRS